ncbi:dTDP-4-dehydrorhamnose 3,5-epimerase family protein [Oerskovia sp. M15]
MGLGPARRRGPSRTYLSEGLGHAFCSLEDGSTVAYLCSTGYAPEREHGIHPWTPPSGSSGPPRPATAPR